MALPVPLFLGERSAFGSGIELVMAVSGRLVSICRALFFRSPLLDTDMSAYREFALLGARRVLVVESGGGSRLAGVITRGDLVEASEDFEGRVARRAAAARRRGRRRGAREYMSAFEDLEGLQAPRDRGPGRSWGVATNER